MMGIWTWRWWIFVPYSCNEGHEQSCESHQRDAKASWGVRSCFRPAHQRTDRRQKRGKHERFVQRWSTVNPTHYQLLFFLFFTAINLRWLTSPWGIFCCILLWCGSTLQPLWSRAKRTLIWLLLVRLKCGFWIRLWNWFDPITDCLLLLYLHFIDLNLEAGIYIQNRLILRW